MYVSTIAGTTRRAEDVGGEGSDTIPVRPELRAAPA